MAKKTSFHHRNLKQALHDAALALLDSDGISAVTIRAVARKVGVSHAAPVNHYKDRRALLTAIAVQQFQNILTDIEQRLSSQDLSASQRVDAIPEVMLDYGLQHPNRYQLLWRRDLVDYADSAIVEITDQIYDWLCAEMQRVVPESAFDRDTVAVALWSMVHGYLDMRQNGMFSEHSDVVNGQPRRRAILDFFRLALGVK